METVAGTMREVILNKVKLANGRRELWEQIVTYVQCHGKLETAEQRAYYNYKDMTGSKPPREWQDDFYIIHPVPISSAVKNEFTRKAIAYHRAKGAK